MATEVIDIVVREKGADAAARSISRIGSAAGGASSAVSLLAKAAVALTAALSVQKIVQYADAYTTLQNRLKLVTTSTRELIQVQNQLFAISNATLQPIGATAELYSRLARATEDLRIPQERLLKITETINKSLIISGTSAQAAEAALIQLGQGLASGTLRGDELNSVLEQAPRLAQAIADGMGVSVGQLRKLGAEGSITAQKIVAALEKSAPGIAAEFNKITPTVEQTFVKLENGAIQAFASLDKITGSSALLRKGIEAVTSILPALVSGFNTGFALAKAVFEQFMAVVSPGFKEIKDFLATAFSSGPGGGFVAAAVASFEFIGQAVLQLPVNVKAAFAIILAEGATAATALKQFFFEAIAGISGAISSLASKLGLDSIAERFRSADEFYQGLASQAGEQKNLRKQTADDYIAQTLRERQASIEQFNERLAQLKQLQAASVASAGLPPIPGVVPAANQPAVSGSGDVGPAVTLQDVQQAIASGSTSGSPNFGQPFGAPPVQGGVVQPVQQSAPLVLPTGQIVNVTTGDGGIDLMRSAFQDEARKAGTR